MEAPFKHELKSLLTRYRSQPEVLEVIQAVLLGYKEAHKDFSKKQKELYKLLAGKLNVSSLHSEYENIQTKNSKQKV